MSILDTGIKTVKNVGALNTGAGCISELPNVLRNAGFSDGKILVFMDMNFKKEEKIDLDILLRSFYWDEVVVDAKEEPTTQKINEYFADITEVGEDVVAVVGIGGGTTMDTAKAIGNLITNRGSAEDYQGWDLLRKPSVFTVGIPTISGTGSESTRTCVMTNKKSGLKLGMNSDHTVFNHIILDPNLTSTVPRSQFFYTGMDAYIHCVEALNGSYRNPIGDAFSEMTVRLCREVFLSPDMMTSENRSKLMVASYLGGCSIATSYVGVVHPFSAGLSVVLGTHHCEANCIVMKQMSEFYPAETREFETFCERQDISVTQNLCTSLEHGDFESLFNATVIHEKPLTNALGEDFLEILTFEKVTDLFRRM